MHIDTLSAVSDVRLRCRATTVLKLEGPAHRFAGVFAVAKAVARSLPLSALRGRIL